MKILKKLQYQDTLTILPLNVCSVLKHSMDIGNDKTVMSIHILCFAETQIQQTQSLADSPNLVFDGFDICSMTINISL